MGSQSALHIFWKYVTHSSVLDESIVGSQVLKYGFTSQVFQINGNLKGLSAILIV